MLLSPWEADEGLHSGAPWKRASQHHTHHPHHRSPAPACVLDCTQPCLHHALAGAADTCPAGELAAQRDLSSGSAPPGHTCEYGMPRPSPPLVPDSPAPQPPSRPSCTCSGVASRRPLSSCCGLSSYLSFPTLCASGSHPRRAGVTTCTCACRGRQEGAYGERTAARLISSVRSTPISARVCPILEVDRRATPGPMTTTPGTFPESFSPSCYPRGVCRHTTRHFS